MTCRIGSYAATPKRRVAGVVMMPLLPFADTQALQIFAKFETDTYKAIQSA